MFKSLFAVIILSITSFSASAANHYPINGGSISVSSDFSSLVINQPGFTNHYHMTSYDMHTLNNKGEEMNVVRFASDDNPDFVTSLIFYPDTKETHFLFGKFENGKLKRNGVFYIPANQVTID